MSRSRHCNDPSLLSNCISSAWRRDPWKQSFAIKNLEVWRLELRAVVWKYASGKEATGTRKVGNLMLPMISPSRFVALNEASQCIAPQQTECRSIDQLQKSSAYTEASEYCIPYQVDCHPLKHRWAASKASSHSLLKGVPNVLFSGTTFTEDHDLACRAPRTSRSESVS